MPDDPNFFYRPTDLNFSSPAVDIKPLMQMVQAGQPTKQPASTNPQAKPGQINPTVGQTFGRQLSDIIQAYRNQVQRYGGGQPQQGVAGQPGPIATPPTPGPPLNILPQGASGTSIY
jgi:hypothetical protein